jgi:hypothetical protein
VNIVFGSLLCRNAFVNSAVALYKYVYRSTFPLYGFTVDVYSMTKSPVFADVA